MDFHNAMSTRASWIFSLKFTINFRVDQQTVFFRNETERHEHTIAIIFITSAIKYTQLFWIKVNELVNFFQIIYYYQ